MSTHRSDFVSDTTDVNNQTNDESYTYGIPSDQINANIPLVGGELRNHYSYPLFQASTQPSNQAAFLWDANNNIYVGGNEQLNPTSYGYVRNNENRVNNSFFPPHSLVQTSSTSALANNSGMITNATSHGCIIIIMKADANLERLLSIIQLCGRVERLYDCPSFFIYRIFWYW